MLKNIYLSIYLSIYVSILILLIGFESRLGFYLFIIVLYFYF